MIKTPIAIYAQLGEFEHKGKTHDEWYVMAYEERLDNNSFFPSNVKGLADLAEVLGCTMTVSGYVVEFVDIDFDNWQMEKKATFWLNEKLVPIAVHDESGCMNIKKLSDCVGNLRAYDDFKQFD